MRKTLAFAFLFVAACDAPTNTQADDVATLPVGDANPAPVIDREPRPTVPAAQSLAVLLQGVGAVEPVLVQVAAIAVNVDGQTLTGTPNAAELDLAAELPWPVATFAVRQGASELIVTLQFQADGTLVRDGATETIDLRGPPISFVAEVDQVQTNGRVVLELDVARSLVDEDGRLVLLPHFTVAY